MQDGGANINRGSGESFYEEMDVLGQTGVTQGASQEKLCQMGIPSREHSDCQKQKGMSVVCLKDQSKIGVAAT